VITNGPFVDRYFLPAIFGVLGATGCLLNRLNRSGIVACGLVLILALGLQEFSFWRAHRQAMSNAPADSVARLAVAAHYQDLPIVISDPLKYVEMSHYASPELRLRLLTLAEPAEAVAYSGKDTVERLVLALRTREPVNVQEYDAFTRKSQVFLLYSNGSASDWWRVKFLRDGALLQLVAASGQHEALYLVKVRKPDVTAGSVSSIGPLPTP